VALGASVWGIILVTVTGIMMAVNSIVAHDVGAGALDKVPHTVRQSLWASVGVAWRQRCWPTWPRWCSTTCS
jgi:MATE family multidrug resistance protein